MSSEKINNALKILKSSFKVFAILIAIIGSIVIIVLSIRLIIKNQPTTNPIPFTISKSVNFKLYYPVKLPKGYYIDQTSFTVESGSVIFSYRDKQGSIIYFTEKSTPDSLQLGGYINANLSNIRVIKNKYGSAYIGTSLVQEPNPIISYVAGTTWVIVNPSANLSNLVLNSLIQSLTPA